MGNAHFKPVMLARAHYMYELEQHRGGYGIELDKQRGEITAGLFHRMRKVRRPVLDGLMYMKRSQAKHQTYAGLYFHMMMSTGRIFYSGESETPDEYCGSHNQFARHGFGEYKEKDNWKYIGFWTNETMDGVGRFTNKITNESFMGVFQDNQFQGWGSYQRRKENKILKHKSSGKQFKGTEYIQICSYFEPQIGDNVQQTMKTITTEDGKEVYQAFPRLQESFFKAGHTTKYVLQILTEYKDKIVNIRRVGQDRYHILSMKPTKLIRVLNREQMLEMKEYTTFSKDCKSLIEGSMDPDFTFREIKYTIRKVLAMSGIKQRYRVSCEFEDQEMVNRFTENLKKSKRIYFIVKSFVVGNENEINMRRHELKMYKLAEAMSLVPSLNICHHDEVNSDLILQYSRLNNLHSDQLLDEFPKKYLIMAEELKSGEFLDAILGFKPMNEHKVLTPLERMVLIQKLLEAYSKLESLGIYHGQVYPCHIYVKGLHTEVLSEWEIVFVDFSEAVYVKENGWESRFEAAALEARETLVRNPYIRFYVHKMYRCPRDQRMFQHPIFYYYARNHFEVPLGKLFFDIRHTDLYSLILIILILLAPSLQTEDAIKKKLEQHTEECFESYYLNQGKNIHKKKKKQQGFLEKRKIDIVSDIITKTYSMNEDIQENIDGLVYSLLDTLQSTTPKLTHQQFLSIDAEVTTIQNVKFSLRDHLGTLVKHFEEHEFRMKPGREKKFGDEELEDFHRTIANRLLGALEASFHIENEEEQKKTNIFERFFGKHWHGKEFQQEENEKQDEMIINEDGEVERRGSEFLDFKQVTKSTHLYRDHSSDQNITLSVSSFEDEGENKEFMKKRSVDYIAPVKGQDNKVLSKKDMLMLNGISKLARSRTGFNVKTKKKGEVSFPWGEDDKYGDVIFEENEDDMSDGNATIRDIDELTEGEQA